MLHNSGDALKYILFNFRHSTCHLPLPTTREQVILYLELLLTPMILLHHHTIYLQC